MKYRKRSKQLLYVLSWELLRVREAGGYRDSTLTLGFKGGEAIVCGFIQISPSSLSDFTTNSLSFCSLKFN